MNKKLVTHFNCEALSISDLKRVFNEYQSLLEYLYNNPEDKDTKVLIEESVSYLAKTCGTYNGKIVKGE